MLAITLGLAIVVFLVPLVYFLVAERAFMREHHAREHAFMSEEERNELLGTDPINLLRALPRDNLRRLNALSTPQSDPRLETLRRRAAAAYLVFLVNMFACIPVTLVVVAAVQRVLDGRLRLLDLIPVAVAALLVCFWASYLMRNPQRRTRAAHVLGVVGIGIAVTLAILYVVVRFIQV